MGKVVSLQERRAQLSEGNADEGNKVTDRTVLVHIEQGTEDGEPFTSATLIGKHHEWDLAATESEFFGDGTITIHLRYKGEGA